MCGKQLAVVCTSQLRFGDNSNFRLFSHTAFGTIQCKKKLRCHCWSIILSSMSWLTHARTRTQITKSVIYAFSSGCYDVSFCVEMLRIHQYFLFDIIFNTFIRHSYDSIGSRYNFFSAKRQPNQSSNQITNQTLNKYIFFIFALRTLMEWSYYSVANTRHIQCEINKMINQVRCAL